MTQNAKSINQVLAYSIVLVCRVQSNRVLITYYYYTRENTAWHRCRMGDIFADILFCARLIHHLHIHTSMYNCL